jgi:RecA-family ATPase
MQRVNFYPHTCKIERSTGTTDENGKEVFLPLYEGECGLQTTYASGQTSLQGGVYFGAPLLVIPDTKTQFFTNDSVMVTDENGRMNRFTVLQAEEIHDAELGGTNIWLKKGDSRDF